MSSSVSAPRDCFNPKDAILRTVALDSNHNSQHELAAIIAERTSPIVLWAGAGLSVSAGLPTWAQLRSALRRQLDQKIAEASGPDAGQLVACRRREQEAVSPWQAFGILKSGLGLTTYRDTIRNCLGPADSCAVPDVYLAMWQLPVRGLINLNLDRLASRAFVETSGSRLPHEFTSRNVGSNTRVLAYPKSTFIFNAHGIHDDASSWVLDHDELRDVLNNQAYKTFIRSVLTTHTVVFLGITVEDAGVGSHLGHLRSMGIETQTHFWITDRNDAGIDKWAENTGVRLIRYRNRSGDHSELIKLLYALKRSTSDAEPVPALPVRPSEPIPSPNRIADKGLVEGLPAPDQLRSEEPELIRLFLNEHASLLLKDDTDDSLVEYSQFVRDYRLAIHDAWYVEVEPPDNEVLGYTISREEAQGAFGIVYKATDREGRVVALKILQEQIRKNGDALTSFRRGVKSMRILKERGVKGMVGFLDAAEIPAMVVMEWVDGADLRKAVASKLLNSWEEILRCAMELASILREAHGLPERVLHRDLRPANIMLEGRGTWHVKVLDFDLSWHRGASDRTLVHTPGTTGYLAPEQIYRIPGVSTRHSSVDSFGLGMTLFFMISGRDPSPNEHQHRDWIGLVSRACSAWRHQKWKSLGPRSARLIIGCTQHEQSKRPDMTTVFLELDRLMHLLVNDSEAARTEVLDVLAEELACRSTQFVGYEWNPDTFSAVRSIDDSMYVELRANEERNRISFTLRRKSTSSKGVTKKISSSLEVARNLLKSAGWAIERHDVSSLEINLVAHWSPDNNSASFDKSAALIDKVSDLLY